MNQFIEYEENKNTIKTLNLDDFSVEELNLYKSELKDEVKRVELEIYKKKNLMSKAEKFFS